MNYCHRNKGNKSYMNVVIITEYVVKTQLKFLNAIKANNIKLKNIKPLQY